MASYGWAKDDAKEDAKEDAKDAEDDAKEAAAAQASSPAAPLSGPSTQGAAAAAQGPARFNPKDYTKPGPKRIDFRFFLNKELWNCLGEVNGQTEPSTLEDVIADKNLDQQTVHAGMLELETRLCVDIPGVYILSPAVCTVFKCVISQGQQRRCRNVLL